MKNTVFVFVCFIFLFGLVSAANAQAPTGNWSSNIFCQNLDTDLPANIKLSFYPHGEAAAALIYDDIIPAGGSKNYDTSELDLPDDFLGAVVVNSTQAVVCTVNTQKAGTGSSESPYRIAASSGTDETETASSMYAPQVMKDYHEWNSYFAVQNTSETEITVEVTYKDRAGNNVPEAAETATIPSYSNTTFNQATNPGLPLEFVGAAKVTVTDPAEAKMTTVVNFYNNGTGSGTSQFHSYNGFSNGASKLYIPRVVRRFYGYNSGVTVQNVGDVDTSVTITFNFAGESYTYNSGTIPQNVALVLYLPDVSVLEPVDSLIVNYRFGNAVVEVDNPEGEIVAIVNEDNRGNAADNDDKEIPGERIGQGSTYSAIPAGSESQTLYFPQVPNNVDGVFSGGFYISNVTGSAGVCDIYFYGAEGANLDDVAIGANGSLSYYIPNIPNVPDGFNAGVRANCSVNVIGILNFAAAPGSGKVGDSFTQNNGFNK